MKDLIVLRHITSSFNAIIFGIAIFAVIFVTSFTNIAYANSNVVSDQTSCQSAPVNGVWHSIGNECTTNGFTLNSGDVLTINPGVVMIINSGGTAIINSGATLSISGSTLLLNSGGVITDSGIIDFNSGGELSTIDTSIININSGGTINIGLGTTDILNSGTININSGGTLNINSAFGSMTNPGQTNVNSGGTFNINSGATFISGNVVNINSGGTVNNSGGFIISGDFSILNVNSGGAISNSGGLTLNGGSLNVNSGGTITNSGSIDITYNGKIANSGSINILSGSVIDNYGILNISSGGIITSSGVITNICGGTINNLGSISGSPFNTKSCYPSISHTETRINPNDVSDQLYPDVSGNILVYTDDRTQVDDIYGYNISTNQEFQVTNSPLNQDEHPHVSNNIIVYTKYGVIPQVYQYDINTGITLPLSSTGYSQSDVAIGGDIATWVDNRDGNPELYTKNMTTGIVSRVTNTAASEASPAVSSTGIVVYESCTYNICSINMFDPSSGIITPITSEGSSYSPDISGSKIVYHSVRNGDFDIYVYDINTKKETRVSIPGIQSIPHISGDWVSFDDTTIGADNVFLYYIPSGAIYQLTSNTSVYGFNDISGNRVVYDDFNGDHIYMSEFVPPNVDNIAPDTVLTSSPSTTTNSLTATFGFTGTDDTTITSNLNFECSLDGSTFTPCTSPVSYSNLNPGTHSFQVRAIDQAGNVDLIPASFSWTILSLVTTGASCTDVITDGAGNTIISATDCSGKVLTEITLPSGTTYTGNVNLDYSTSGTNSKSEITGVVVPYPPGKSIKTTSNPGTSKACIIDSPTKVSLESLSCGSDTSQSKVVLDCSSTGTTTTVLGFPDSPTTRTYTCTTSNVGGQDYLKIDGLAFSAIVIDGTSPTISFVGGINNGDSFLFGSVPAAPTCDATDDLSSVDGSCTVTGYSSSLGDHTLTATAKDGSGNVGTATLTYHVLPWIISGFYSPVDMGSIINTVKAGGTVPLKFEVFKGTTELTDTSIATLSQKQVTCVSGATLSDIAIVATGETSLRYDATSGQFIYNWKTLKSSSNCYDVTLTTSDGSSITAHFKLK